MRTIGGPFLFWHFILSSYPAGNPHQAPRMRGLRIVFNLGRRWNPHVPLIRTTIPFLVKNVSLQDPFGRRLSPPFNVCRHLSNVFAARREWCDSCFLRAAAVNRNGSVLTKDKHSCDDHKADTFHKKKSARSNCCLRPLI